MCKAIGYVRVSSEQQVERGVSLAAQAEKVRAMATVQGVELVDIIVDAGQSAASMKRPGLQRLMDMVDAGEVQSVIIAKLDRLTRSVKDLATILERFQRKGVSLVSVADSLDTGSAAGRLVLNIMVSVSQWEREAIGERTRDALQHKKATGQRAGNIPFGFSVAADGKALVQNPAEQAILAKLRDLRRLGYTLRAIAAKLNEHGLKTRKGGAWKHQYVAALAT